MKKSPNCPTQHVWGPGSALGVCICWRCSSLPLGTQEGTESWLHTHCTGETLGLWFLPLVLAAGTVEGHRGECHCAKPGVHCDNSTQSGWDNPPWPKQPGPQPAAMDLAGATSHQGLQLVREGPVDLVLLCVLVLKVFHRQGQLCHSGGKSRRGEWGVCRCLSSSPAYACVSRNSTGTLGSTSPGTRPGVRCFLPGDL